MSKLPVLCLLMLMSISLASGAFSSAEQAAPENTLHPQTQATAAQPFAAVTVITAQEITDYSLRSIADVLRLVPGVYVQQSGEFGSPAFARIRGMNANQILVLVNGERVTNPSFSLGTDLARFTTEDITRIEITRGTLSSSYGSNAIGGVINIITEQETPQAGGTAELGVGSDGRQSRALLLNGAGKTPWRAGVISPVYDGSQPNSKFAGTRFFANVAPSLGDWKITVRAHHFQDSTGLFKWRYVIPPLGNIGVWIRDLDDHQSSDRTSYSLSASRPVGKGGFGINGYHIEQELEQTLTTDTESTSPTVTGTTEVADLNYIYSINRHTFTVGGEQREEKYESTDSETSITQHKQITDKGLYLEDRWTPNAKTYVTMGARYDDHSIAGNIFSPRVGIIHSLPKGMKLRATYAEGFRPPGFMELYSTDSGNIDLDPETARQYELALTSTRGKNTVEVVAFQYDIRDLIVLTDDVIPQYENIDDTRQRGVELVWQHQHSPKFSYTISYTFVDAIDRSTNEQLPDAPRNMATLTARHMMGKWQMFLTGWYNGKLRETTGLRVPGRTVFDLSVIGSIDGIFQPYLTIRNLTNTPLTQDGDGFQSDGIKFEAGIRSAW